MHIFVATLVEMRVGTSGPHTVRGQTFCGVYECVGGGCSGPFLDPSSTVLRAASWTELLAKKCRIRPRSPGATPTPLPRISVGPTKGVGGLYPLRGFQRVSEGPW